MSAAANISQMDEGLKSELQKSGIFMTTLESLYNWGRRSSIWPLQFGLACCAIEMIATACARYDIDRFGAGLFRPSPRQADLMIVSGTVTKKMAPQVVRLYNQMPEPKYCITMGACSISGGPFKDGYNVLKGIDRYIPVDVHLPGCPPRPEALLHGLMKLQQKIDSQERVFAVLSEKFNTVLNSFIKSFFQVVLIKGSVFIGKVFCNHCNCLP